MRLRLPLATLALGFLICAIGTWLTAQKTFQTVRMHASRRGSALLHAIEHAADAVQNQGDLQRFVMSMADEPDVKLIVVATERGHRPPTIIASTRVDWVGRPLDVVPDAHMRRRLANAFDYHATLSGDLPDGSAVRLSGPVAAKRGESSRSPGAVVIDLDPTRSKSAWRAQAWQVALFSLATVLAATLACMAVTALLVLHPISVLQSAIIARRQGDRTARAPVVRNDEIGEVAAEFNRMLDAVDLGETAAIAHAEAMEIACRELEFLRFALDQHSDVSMTDGRGRITHVNQRCCEVSGYSREELLGSDHRILASGFHSPEYWRQMYATTSAGTVWQGEVCNRRRDGRLYWEDSTIVPLLSPDGAVERYIAIRTDISARKSADDALRHERARLQAFVEHAPAAIAMFDRDMRYVAVSQRWLHDYQLTEEIIGRSHYEVFPECPERWKEIHQQCLAGRVERYDGDVWRPERATEEQYLRWEVRPWYLGDGSIGGLMMFTEDITALKKIEASLQTALARSEAANRTKSEFLANMSHEIRTPMTAILGYAELMLDDPDLAGDEVRRNDSLRTIRRNGEHLLSVINDILDISKIEAGMMTFESIACSPRRIVEDLALMMRPRAESQGIEFKIEYEGEIPAAMRSDPVRLRQILVNLAGNAIKFTSQGSVRLVTRVVASPRAQLQFDVIDTGVGMPPEQIERLFAPFMQGDASTTRKFGGTGLGLAISRRLAELLGGEVVLVSSAPGKGSQFRLTLPSGVNAGDQLAPPESESSTVSQSLRLSALTAPLTGCQVLLAEDGLDNQRLIAHVIRRVGAQVEIVDNGEKAVAAVLAAETKGRRFDVVLMDMQMPILDGYEATARLRAKGYSGAIVALTAHAMSDDREKCLQAGCNEYLTKPLNRRTLVAMLLKFYEPIEIAAGI